jgi:hypothetical protein
MLSGRRRLALVGLPSLLVAGTAYLIVRVVSSYHEAATRWTAIAAILGGAALAAALIGLPIALAQLFLVERDLASLTRPGAAHDLRFHIAMGRQLQRRLAGGGMGATPETPSEVDKWTQQGYDRLQGWPTLAQRFLDAHKGYSRSFWVEQLSEAPAILEARIACLETLVRELESDSHQTSA